MERVCGVSDKDLILRLSARYFNFISSIPTESIWSANAAAEIQTCKSFLPDLDRFKFVTLDLRLDADSPGHLHASLFLSQLAAQICFYRSLFILGNASKSIACNYFAICGNNVDFFSLTQSSHLRHSVSIFFLPKIHYISDNVAQDICVDPCSWVCDVWWMMRESGMSVMLQPFVAGWGESHVHARTGGLS